MGPFICCVCENERQTGRNICSVAVHSLPRPAEPVQTPDRLLAGRLARESSNSWMMEGKGGEEQGKREPRQCRPVPRLQPLETSEERKRRGG